MKSLKNLLQSLHRSHGLLASALALVQVQALPQFA